MHDVDVGLLRIRSLPNVRSDASLEEFEQEESFTG